MQIPTSASKHPILVRIANEILMHFRSQKKLQGEVSLSDTLDSDGDGNSLSLMDVISVDDDMLENLNARDSCIQLRRYIDQCLNDREKMIITMRYGLDNHPPRTQREIAAESGISRSYVSRPAYCKQCLKKPVFMRVCGHCFFRVLPQGSAALIVSIGKINKNRGGHSSILPKHAFEQDKLGFLAFLPKIDYTEKDKGREIMEQKNAIKLFEDKKIRTAWDEEQEKWYFSIVDTCEVLSGTDNPRRYWSDLKRKLKKEGAEQLYEKIVQLKLQSADGKFYKTDVADTEQLLRLIQSIPSPKAEPFKRWLAMVGSERIDEITDPELTIDRALEGYLKLGYSREWINQRLQAIQVRKELTDEWADRGVSKGQEYAILTDEITRTWSGMTTRQYKGLKGLKKENLRDNMSTMELVLNMLAEATTTELSKVKQPEGFEESRKVAHEGGSVAGSARKDIESRTGRPVITSDSAAELRGIPEPTEKKE